MAVTIGQKPFGVLKHNMMVVIISSLVPVTIGQKPFGVLKPL